MKLQAFQQFLKEKKVDVAFFHNLDEKLNASMYYFSQYLGAGVLLIPQSGKPILVVPQLDDERARKTKMRVVTWKKKKLFEVLQEVVKKRRMNKIGIDKNHISLVWNSILKKKFGKPLVDMNKTLVALRRQKTKEEQSIIREACKIKGEIFNKTLDQWHTFKTETDVAAYFQYLAAKQGLLTSFPMIVASGKNASSPHYEPQNTKLQKGFCVIDCGIKYKGYCTDMTRTVFVGTPSKKEKDHYEKIKNIQESVMDLYKVGTKVADLDVFVRKKLGSLEKYFIHSLGHGVGIDVHEAPHISNRSKEILLENEYVTNEPGIYIPKKMGIRIEDDILITKKGPEVLTKMCSKELICL